MSRRKPGDQGQSEVGVLLIGSGGRAQGIADRLEQDTRRPVRIRGFLDDDPTEEDLRAIGARYLGRVDRLADLASRGDVSWVIFALPRRFLAQEATANAIGVCETLGIELTIPVDLFDTRAAHVRMSDIAGLPAVSFSVHGRRSSLQLAIKRGLDILGAIGVLILTAPIWIAAAIAIKLDSPGPIFFAQKRCGLYGREFSLWKFRTMGRDAEARKAELQARNEKSGPVFKITHDPRVTRVGRVLRRYSIDELPQLLNVLAGEMSLVGPRPPVPAEVAKYELDHRGRLSMRPGITCLWQVSGRNQIEFEDWVKLDLEYIERWSLLLDFQILLATLPAVVSGRGAS
jgi:exopolysaccharide biosynthesis polyprenyl glycosylphosphotransferase